jgi:starch-binding outer membrane protein, SusD/RagB family
MKRIIIFPIAFLLLAVLLNAGCVKLKEVPPGALAPNNFYSTTSDYDAAIVGAIQPMFYNYTSWDFNGPFILCYGAEDCTTRPQATDSKLFDELKPDPSSSTLSQCWSMCYQAVDNADAIIANLPLATAMSAADKAPYDGEARFLRAINYFYLTRWWGKVPLITEKNYTNTDTVAEAEVANIYALMVSDLQTAITELPTTAKSIGLPTQGAAQGLLAKVYLTMAGWPIMDNTKYALAENMAQAVMTAGKYQLQPNFQDLWLAANKTTNTEFMFFLNGISTSASALGSHHHVATRPTEEGGWSDRFSEARFLNEFPAGPRKDASFHTTFTTGISWQQSLYAQPYISKYRDAGAAATLNGPIINPNAGDGFSVLLRYADVLLIYAESANMNEGGPSAAAYNAINQVRRRANGAAINTPNPAYDLVPGLSQAAFDDSVIAERNWELAFEANRWFDLVRKQMVISVNQSLYPYVDAHNSLLPKPSAEVQLLKGYLNQNTGY